MSNAEAAYAVLKPTEGDERGHGDWFEITQEQISAFADCTVDHQFIHIDEERAKAETPFGGTIAHGFLTLSMLTHLMQSVPVNTPRLEGAVRASTTASTGCASSAPSTGASGCGLTPWSSRWNSKRHRSRR